MTEKATTAREKVGLTLEQAAKKARVGVAYLRYVERHGCSFVLAERLSRIYACNIDVFLPTRSGGGTPKTTALRRSRNRQGAYKV
jgi:hypothetical protein